MGHHRNTNVLWLLGNSSGFAVSATNGCARFATKVDDVLEKLSRPDEECAAAIRAQ